jgi:hypothetical protein
MFELLNISWRRMAIVDTKPFIMPIALYSISDNFLRDGNQNAGEDLQAVIGLPVESA